MRTAFIEQLVVEARRNPRIFLVVGDLGYSVVESFAAEFPERFLNAGVAEQNMTGLAAGLASEGHHVFTYSIGNFATLRCLEQIRNDVCYHRYPVTVVAVGAGMSYGNQGSSHHCVQDIGCLRGLPHMTILSPADAIAAKACVRWLSENPSPSYLRIGKTGEPNVHGAEPSLGGSPCKIVDHDGDTAIVGTGPILAEAVAAAEQLIQAGRAVDVWAMTRLSPAAAIDLGALRRYRRILTLEEHVAAGGLGELVRSQLGAHGDLRSLCLPESLEAVCGSQAALRQRAGVDASAIARAVTSGSAFEASGGYGGA